MTTPSNSPAAEPLFGSGQARSLRQPLGMPAGSVRALLALMVMGIIWTLMLLPETRDVKIPLYLFYLMFLILGHYFAAHGHSIAGPATGRGSPLHLPKGSIRFILVFGFVAVLGYRYYVHRDLDHLFELREPLVEQPYLPLILIGAFFGGILFSRVIGRMLSGHEGPPAWFQDVLAWIALLGTLGLVVEIVIIFVINPGLAVEQQIHLPAWQNSLAGVVSFYFGARS